MTQYLQHPAYLFVTLIVCLPLAAALGAVVLDRRFPLSEEARENYNVVQGATLTLLALLIGFTLSMAVGRYDQRKNLEEEEANAIGTEYLRADLIGGAGAANLKALLAKYTETRVLYYTTHESHALARINRTTADLQTQLWNGVRDAAAAQPNPVTALVVAGMNDVINTQGYTQAAWINRIPVAAWILMIIIALFSNLMQGYGARGKSGKRILLFVLPITVSLSLTLIADIDSPRGGLIRVAPLNLISFQQSLPAQH
ncbi:hypothetical protein [Paraburkholderia tropica]|uniref:bestrophin-like domain n=1 Tax=Paraburkholderia tropica TaxID=92647 RepID=UPI0007ED9791|nr:hypothetical protein [Paraburkholderia tropica]MBB2980282.1 hypothetical protein [Paraburkholderia tropica]OBR52853.1 hypothetical protein A6456_11710 [Paraburkholderia tropica]